MNGLDMALHENFCHNVRKRRQELGLSQRDLAERLEVSNPYICQVEAGKMNPSLAVVERFAKALSCPAVALLVAEEVAAV